MLEFRRFPMLLKRVFSTGNFSLDLFILFENYYSTSVQITRKLKLINIIFEKNYRSFEINEVYSDYASEASVLSLQAQK